MATSTREQLKSKWTKQAFKNFGEAIIGLDVREFRSINNLNVTFDYPVVAISGKNGTGKSTLLQLLATGYRAPKGMKASRHYVSDYFVKTRFDSDPFNPSSQITYKYAGEEPFQALIQQAVDRWRGYEKQPERAVYYLGISLFTPKVELSTASKNQYKESRLSQALSLEPDIQQRASEILGIDYKKIESIELSYKSQKRRIQLDRASASKDIQYTDINMGFGEARVIKLLSLIEEAPRQSLFILEEPEIALHESAQARFVDYMIEQSNINGHQFVFSTHSSDMFASLPSEARLMLFRNKDGDIKILKNTDPHLLKTWLSDFKHKVLRVYVEDEMAKAVIIAALRELRGADVIQALEITPVGTHKTVETALKEVHRDKDRVIGFLDPDMPESRTPKVFVLPGDKSFEASMLDSQEVTSALEAHFGQKIVMRAIKEAKQDPHKLISYIAYESGFSDQVVTEHAATQYVKAKTKNYFSEISKTIEKYLYEPEST